MSSQKYGTRLTPDGYDMIAAAITSNKPINIVKMAVGDGDWLDALPNDLLNKVWEGPVNSVEDVKGGGWFSNC